MTSDKKVRNYVITFILVLCVIAYIFSQLNKPIFKEKLEGTVLKITEERQPARVASLIFAHISLENNKVIKVIWPQLKTRPTRGTKIIVYKYHRKYTKKVEYQLVYKGEKINRLH